MVGEVAVGGTVVQGSIEFAGDRDGFGFDVTSGKTYEINVTSGTLADPEIIVGSATTSSVTPSNTSGGETYSYTATVTELGFVIVFAADGVSTGTYTVSVTETP